MSVKEIIAAEFESLEVFLAKFNFSNFEIQEQIFEEVIATLQRLPQEEGTFIVSESSKAIILALEEKIIKLVESGQYVKNYKSLVKNFDTIEQIRKEVNALVNPKDKLKVFKTETSKIRKGYINKLSESLGKKETFGLNVIDPIKGILFEYSTLGLPVKEATNRLFDFAMGSGANGGVLVRYSGQVAHDALFGFTGAIDKEIGDYIGAADANYLGNVIKDSRPQCVRWVVKFNGFIPGDQLKSEIQWAKDNGEGYSKHLPELTVKTFPIVRGGHNCRHRVIMSKGKSSKVINDIEDRYKVESDKFNEGLEAELTGITLKRYQAQKAAVEKLVKNFGK